jgi:hypothetical protein
MSENIERLRRYIMGRLIVSLKATLSSMNERDMHGRLNDKLMVEICDFIMSKLGHPTVTDTASRKALKHVTGQ